MIGFTRLSLHGILWPGGVCGVWRPKVQRSGSSLFALVVAVTPALADTPPEGLALFEKLCVECHATPARILRKLPSQIDERQQALAKLLAEHHAPDPVERAALMDWLLAQ